jgi:hypothetical protein
MKSRVLYFPYIQVPENSWLTQMLLYWDQVSSIVPYEFTMHPEELGPYMQSLLREELVFQLMPGMYVFDIPNFFEKFNGYIEGLGPRMDARRKNLKRRKPTRVHIEKLGDLGDMLVRQRLASPQQYPWYHVERETADDFMSYLAAALGQLPAVDSSPVTDNSAYLGRLARTGVARDALNSQLQSVRIQVLDRVLPVPKHAVEPPKIRAFKDRHRDKLGDFRRRVERELIEALNISDPDLRQRHLDLFFDEAEERIQEIQAEMHGSGWETAKAGVAVIGAIPGVSPIVGLVGALWNAGTGEPRQIPQDFAYAAHARSELLGETRQEASERTQT